MKTSIKLIIFTMALACVEGVFALTQGTVENHEGTDYYSDGTTVYIQTLAAFQDISNLSNSIKSYALANDIYFNETAPEEGCESDRQSPISFSGTLDGKGYSIKNLCLTSEYSTIALFSNGGNNSTIRNLTISNAYIYSGTTTESAALFYTGLTAGLTIFDNVHIENAVIKGQGKNVGGFIGGTTNAAKVNFINCSFEGDIIASNSINVGAFMGYAADDTQITNSYAKANINVSTNKNTILGGLVGEFANDALIKSSYFKGNISITASASKINVGGLVGMFNVQDSIEIASSYATNVNDISSDDFITVNLTNATGYNVGGLIGHLQAYYVSTPILGPIPVDTAFAYLHESFAKGAIKVSGSITGSPTNYIGGIIGWSKNNNWYKLNNSYYIGAITAPTNDNHKVYGLSSDTSAVNSIENYNGNVRSSFAYDANGTATRAIRGMYNWGTWSTTKDSKHGEYTVAFTTDKEKSVAVSANVDGSSNRNMVLTSKAFADLLEKYDDNPENITWIYDAKLNEGFPSLLSELPGKTFTIVVDDTVKSTDVFKLPTDKIPTSYEYGAESVVFPKLASLKGCFTGWNVNGEDLADGFTWNPGDSYGTATATPIFDAETCNKTITLETNSSYGVEWDIKTGSVSMPVEDGKATLPNLNGLVYTVAAAPIDASESIVEIASDKLDISDDEFVYDGNEATITATTKADYYYVKWLKNEETVAMAHAIGATYLAEDGTDIDLATLPAIGIGKEDGAFGYYANGDEMWNGENSIAKDVSFTYTALKSVNITVDNIDGIRISGSILEGSFDYELANNKSTAVPVLEKMTIDTLKVLIVQFDALGNRIAYEVSADGKLVLESGVTSVLVTPVAEYAINVMVPTDKGIIFTNDEQPTSYIVGDASVTFPKLATTKACFTGYTGKADIVTEWVPEDSYGDVEFTAAFDSECTPKTNKISVTADSKIDITVTYKDQALEIVDNNILVPEGEWPLIVTAVSTFDRLTLDSIYWNGSMIATGETVKVSGNTDLTAYTTLIKPEPEKPDTIPIVEPDTTYSDTLEVVQSEILFSGSALKFEISTNGSKITNVATLRVKIYAADSIYLDSLVSDSALAQKYNFEYYPLPAGSYTVVAELANDRDTSVTKASAFAIDSVIATILPEQWAMISLAGVDSTFEIPEYEQGSIYYWDEENALGEFWQYRSLVDVAEIQPTQGYWIYAEDSMVVKHLGTVAKAESLEWNLKNRYTGWNLVANPYSWKILLPSSEFDDPENAMEPYWRWNASKNTYEVADTLNVFEAVWAHTDENKVVTIDAKPIYSSNIVAAPKSSAPAKKSWSLRLKLASDNGIDEWNSIGVGTREISLFAPPASMRDGVSLSIKDGNNDLAKSIKSSVENASWNVAFEASSIQNAKLSVDGLEALQELGLQATLTMDGESVVLEPNESVDVVVSALAKNAEIEVAPIAQIAKASGIQNLRFNRAGNMLDVSFELASNEASKNADIRLIDARGKTVSFIQEKPVAGLNKISIAIPEASGVFYLQVKVGKHSKLKRIAF